MSRAFCVSHLLAATALTLAAPVNAHADDPKQACVDASTRGQKLRADGKLVEARTQFLACVAEACPQVVRQHCSRWLSEVEAATPSFVVSAQDGEGTDLVDVRLTVDGKPVTTKLDGRPLPMNPGEHVVVVTDRTGRRQEDRVLLVEGQKSRLLHIVFPSPAPDLSTRRMTRERRVPLATWVLGEIGVVGMGSFGYFAWKSSDTFYRLKSSCAPNCTETSASLARQQALVADLSLGVGVAALGTAIAWWLFAQNREETRARAMIAPKPLSGGGGIDFTARF